jgi:hypothetical protein
MVDPHWKERNTVTVAATAAAPSPESMAHATTLSGRDGDNQATDR